MKTNITIKLESPLVHFSDDNLGVIQAFRTQKFVQGTDILNIPVYSGNALRGSIRRLIMRDYVEMLGMDVSGISEKLYYTLFNGGSLQSGDTGEDLEFKRKLRRLCPPLSLMGTAIGNSMIQGKLKVGIAVPRCEELDGEDWPSIGGLTEDIFFTRLDDLKHAYDVPLKVEKKENAVQMKYEVQALATGTELHTYMDLMIPNDVEVACMARMLEKLKEFGYLGGKSQAGLGKVSISWDRELSSDAYVKFVKDNADEIRAWLEEVDKGL